MKYRYYLTLRPAMPGTVPTKNLVAVFNFDERKFVKDAGREVWGYVKYSEPLTDKQIYDYELIVGGTCND